MLRLRLYDLLLSRLPKAIGTCGSDVAGVAQIVNDAQESLLLAKEQGDEGWWGTWAEMIFNVDPCFPFITTPREVARIEVASICNQTAEVRNQFYDFLAFGNRRLFTSFVGTPGQITLPFRCWSGFDVHDRNNVPTFRELTNGPQNVVVFPGDASDVGKNVLLQGLDSTGNIIYGQDGVNRILGQAFTLQQPFVVAPFPMNRITGIQKDQTNANVQFFQQDPTTGAEIQLHTMEPSETTAWYRRYHLTQLPPNCCGNVSVINPCSGTTSTVNTIRVRAIVKLELIPVQAPTDYTLLQNKEAIIHEAQSLRYSTMDTPQAKNFQTFHHKTAIGLLNGELGHRVGTLNPSVSFTPFGSARLSRQKIGSLI